MGDVQHVVDFISKQFSAEGVACNAEGKGVLWVTPPPNFRDVNIFYTELSNIEGVTAIDQETNGTQVRIKIMVSDRQSERPSFMLQNTFKIQHSWLQTYLTSTWVLVGLSAGLVAIYGRSAINTLEQMYFTTVDETL